MSRIRSVYTSFLLLTQRQPKVGAPISTSGQEDTLHFTSAVGVHLPSSWVYSYHLLTIVDNVGLQCHWPRARWAQIVAYDG